MTTKDSSTDDTGLNRTVALLGGKSTLQRTIRNSLDAHDLMREGLPNQVLRHLVVQVGSLTDNSAGLEKAVGLSLRTYQRRKDAGEKRLSVEQSGRTWKFAEILGRATDLLGSQSEAERWLERPAMALEQRKPLDLLSTPAGVEMVETYLTRLEFGVYT